MNSNLRSLLGALQQRADLVVLKPLITPETAKAKDIFYGLLPLFWALSYGAPAEVLRALLDAYPAAAEEKHPQGWTPLHYAEKLDAEALKLLLARCPKTASREVDNEGALPLHWVAEHDAPKEVVELLLEAYPEGLSKRDGRGRVPAQLAMEASLEVKQLLEAANPRAFRRMPAPEPIAVIVPGLPGNEYVGMLKDVEELPYIKDLLSQAKTLLGLDLVKVSSTSPINLEELPCQHALMYVSGVAAVQRLQKMEKCPAGNFQVLAGLSVGEYVALAIAGVFSFDDGLRLVLQRAKVLARSTDQATLWVTGLDEAKVLDLCRNAATGANEVCEISGYLHKSSFTVGGTRSAVEAFKSMAKDAKAFQLEYLQGWGAVHTKLSQSALDTFEVELQKILPRMSPARCQVVMNATGRLIDSSTDSEEVLRLLGQQLIMPVRWKDSMELLGKLKVEEIFECGAKKQLKGLMKRIDNDLWWRTGNV